MNVLFFSHNKSNIHTISSPPPSLSAVYWWLAGSDTHSYSDSVQSWSHSRRWTLNSLKGRLASQLCPTAGPRCSATNCNSIASLSRSISSCWPPAQLYSWPRLDDITLGVFCGLLGLRGSPLVYHDMSAQCVNQTLPWEVPVGLEGEEWLPGKAHYISTHCRTETLFLDKQCN